MIRSRHVFALAITAVLLLSAPAASGAGTGLQSSTVSPVDELRVAVLLVNFAQQPSEPWTKDAVRDLYFGNSHSVASYYAELSEGQLSISGSVFGYLKVRTDRSGCYFKDWAAAARSAARSAGVSLGSFTNIVYVFPYQRTCWWNGFSADGPKGELGRDSWVNGLLTLYVAVHELGHNLGVGHASSLTCTAGDTRVAFSSKCSTYEYGDPYDVMGYGGTRHVNAWHRRELGFLDDSEVLAVTESGTYHLSPAEFAAAGPRMLQIQRPNGGLYFLEIRQPFGAYDDFDADAPAVRGVTIRTASATAGSNTRLIDTVPESCTFNDAPLRPGETFSDSINRISITTIGVDSSGADVEIRLGNSISSGTTNDDGNADGPPDTSPPTAVERIRATQVTGRLVAVDWTAAADNVGVDRYLVTVDGLLRGSTCDLMLRNVSLKDGQTYEIGVQAVDTADNVGPLQTISYSVPDYTSPTLPGKLSATVRTASIGLRWSGGADNVAVDRYSIRRNGHEMAEVGAGVLTYVDKTPLAGWNTYSVVAFDAAGNASRPIAKAVRG